MNVDLPGGPYLRVAALGLTATVTVDSTDYTLTGDFSFDQVERDDGAGGTVTVTRLALANVTLTTGGVTLENGRGAFVITATGVAGGRP